MADLSKITLPNGSNYNLKDRYAYRIGNEVSHRNVNEPSKDPAYAILTTPKNALDYQILRTVAGVGDWFYALHINPDYTVTSNYNGSHGAKGNFHISTLFSPSAASTVLLDVDSIAETPFVLTIQKKSGVITATDVVHLELFTHTLRQSYARLTDYKVELYTTGNTSSSGTFTWQIVYERHGVSDSPNGLCITLNPTSYPYIYFSGVRFTIEGATPGSTSTSSWNYNCLDLSLFRLMDQRPAFSAARSIGALDIAGGSVYGTTTFSGGITGNLTGKVNGYTISKDVPSNAVFTDTKDLTQMTGTLSVSHGGTGATTLASGAALIGNGTGAVTTRAIRNHTSTIASIGWTNLEESIQLLTQNDIAYWNGRYNDTSSNLKYASVGELKAAATYEVETAVANDSKLPTGAAVKSFVEGKGYVTTDTKNTAGSTDTSSKIFLVGATSQAANPQTYSDNEVYATNGKLSMKEAQIGGDSGPIARYNTTTKSLDFVFS